MANIKSAKKRIRVINKKTAKNTRVKNHVKEAEKAFNAAILSGDKSEATLAFKKAEKKLMQAAAKGVYHKNAVARTISRFERKLNAIGGEATVAAVKAEKVVNEVAGDKEAVKADASMKKDELIAIASEMGIEIPSKATKAEILAAIESK